jgi:hypothetical protein
MIPMTIDPHSAAANGVRERTAPIWRVPASILAISVALCSTISAATQDWTLLDEVTGGNARAIVSDSVGNVYIAGGINDPVGVNGGLILKSSDRGQTWDADPSTSNEDPSFYLPGASTSFGALATAHVQIGPGQFQDQIVAIGYSPAGWFAYRTVNAGALGTWSQVATPSNWNFLGYTEPALNSASIDSLGNIYVAGNAKKTTTITTTVKKKTTTTTVTETRWLVFKGTRTVNQEGVESCSWSTIDDFAAGSARGVACAGSDVFVAGNNEAFWHVRKSSNGGATWENVDHFQMSPGAGAQAFAITVDRGRVIVAGYAYGTQSVSPSYWIVRSGTGIGTNSFRTVDNIGGPLANNKAYALTVAPDGSVYASGWLHGSTGIVAWTTRKGNETNGIWSWSNPSDDSFSFAPDQYSQCFGIAATPATPSNPLGDVFAIGIARYHASWLVRARLAP